MSIAAALVAVFAVALQVMSRNSFALLAFDDLSQAAAALIGSCCCFYRASNCQARSRSSWLLFGAGTASWGIGELIWSYYEVALRRDTPFPSWADAGFLLFPVLAMAGLLASPSRAFSRRGRRRVLLDAILISVSLFNLTWSTTLGTVFHAGADSHFAFIVGLAYPVTDLLVLSVAVLVLADAEVRNKLVVLVAGMAGLAVSDSAFEYLTTTGHYNTGSPIDIGWVAGFLLLGVAAMLDTSASEVVAQDKDVASTFYLLLPYALGAVGITVTIIGVARRSHDDATLFAGAVALAALFIRQLLTLLENKQLILDVASKQEALLHQAFHDGLTGLANRALFRDRVTHALELHARDLRPVSVVFCDLDDFKAVNDSFGHAAGDILLVAVAERLRGAVRSGDTVARLGGDEFAILVEHEGDAERLSTRLKESFAAPVNVSGRQVPVRASVGVAMVEAIDTSVDCDELLIRADLAMYSAKRSGKARTVLYTEDLRQPERDTGDLASALPAAIAAGLLSPVFQPIFAADRSVFGYEALARWTHLDQPVAATVLVTTAERIGQLAALDLRIISSASSVLRASDSTPDGPVLSVNVGLASLADASLPMRITAELGRLNLDPSRLMVEVLEDDHIDSPAVRQTLTALREAGVKLALDHFGAGHSSLSRLRALSPDVVKLDRSFIAELDSATSSTDIVSGIIELSRRAGAQVIATGIETPRQLAVLTELGCDAFQGHLLGHPQASLLTRPWPLAVSDQPAA